MKTIEAWQMRRFNQLLGQLGLQDKETKQHMILSATQGRTDSTTGLYYHEAVDLIRALERLRPTPPRDGADVMRKKIISMCHEMGMQLPGTTRIDMVQVNNLVQAKGYLKKPLNDYSMAELPDLVSQVEKILRHYYKKQTV